MEKPVSPTSLFPKKIRKNIVGNSIRETRTQWTAQTLWPLHRTPEIVRVSVGIATMTRRTSRRGFSNATMSIILNGSFCLYLASQHLRIFNLDLFNTKVIKILPEHHKLGHLETTCFCRWPLNDQESFRSSPKMTETRGVIVQSREGFNDFSANAYKPPS